jgi:hypothetical protein
MKIVAKVEKSGQLLAQSELKLAQGDDPAERAAKALARLRKQTPNVPLFDEDVRVKFEKVDDSKR